MRGFGGRGFVVSNAVTSGSNKRPEAADIHIGRRVQERRRQMGISQERLGERLGITFQQVQKYEKGANRIGAGRLYTISEILEIPVGHFFDGLGAARSGGLRDGDGQMPFGADRSQEAERLTRDFARIEDPDVRARILDLVKVLAAVHRPVANGRD